MITVFVTKEGYYINGDGVEAALRCSPALDERGNPIFNELHHIYKVLFMALKAICNKPINGDVIVYNDSRIVDEMNNNTSPIDETTTKWRRTIKRDVIPHIKSVVFFRKKSKDYINAQIGLGNDLILSITQENINKIQQIEKKQRQSFKNRALERFKRRKHDRH